MTYNDGYCSDNGTFCPFMDKSSCLCIATSCKWATDILQQQEIDFQTWALKENENGRFEIEDEKYIRALELMNKKCGTLIF